MSKSSITVTVADLIPANAQYDFDPSTNLATITIEHNPKNKIGHVEYGEVTARLRVAGKGEDAALEAEYVSHTGDLCERQIQYALRAIETNDFGV